MGLCDFSVQKQARYVRNHTWTCPTCEMSLACLTGRVYDVYQCRHCNRTFAVVASGVVAQLYSSLCPLSRGGEQCARCTA